MRVGRLFAGYCAARSLQQRERRARGQYTKATRTSRGSPWRHHANDENQNAGAKERNPRAAPESRVPFYKEPQDKSADQRPGQSANEVADQTKTAALHD